MNKPGKIVLAGFLVRYPLGGYAWQAANYLLGFRALGWDVYFYEETEFYPPAFNPIKKDYEHDYSYGVGAAAKFFDRVGFGDKWIFFDSANKEEFGPCSGQAQTLLRDADLLINLGGINRIAAERRGGKPTVYIDFDPGYTQLRLANGDESLKALLDEQALLFTYGENIGTERTKAPTGGYSWNPTRPPVALEFWPITERPGAAYTTIGAWNSSNRDLAFDGRIFRWRKRTEWLRYLELPRLTRVPFEVAMDVESVPGDAEILRQHHWNIRDPLGVSADPWSYRDYIVRSRGEFTVAKEMNVELRTGWFSDRSACYLAAGRPVVVQDTAFGDVISLGPGLRAFRTLSDAAESIKDIESDYARASANAREIARECFAAERVAAEILARI